MAEGGTAPSHFKWPVTVEQPIPVAASRVWDAISSPGHLEKIHPFCYANPVQVWSREESRDEVHYLSGWIFERIGRHGGRRSFVSWRVASLDDDRCVLAITVYPHPLRGVPTVIRWLPHAVRLRPLLRRYLSSVVRGCEWYVTRGEPVPRNQFGSHPWFSA